VMPGRYRLTATPPAKSAYERAALVADVGEDRDVTMLVLELRAR
jgi:hypothetical protein